MVSLTTQKDFRSVQNLPFCYLCGKEFVLTDAKNRDHVPPENIFLPQHREPLCLPTHIACNKSYSLVDEKIGQLIALRYGKVPSKLSHRRLRFTVSPDRKHGAVINLNIDDAVWRWVAAFHAALYCQPLKPSINRSLVTPFPKAQKVGGRIVFEPLKQQHAMFVERIKLNRAKGNVDLISCNKGKLVYECVWDQANNDGAWVCIFALDIYDWKDLGRTALHPARGCAGHYVLSSGARPDTATRGMESVIRVPNLDPLDPFGP